MSPKCVLSDRLQNAAVIDINAAMRSDFLLFLNKRRCDCLTKCSSCYLANYRITYMYIVT